MGLSIADMKGTFRQVNDTFKVGGWIRDERCIFDCDFLPLCPAITKPGLCWDNNNDSAGLSTWEIEKT